MSLFSEKFRNDPRVSKARDLLQDALKENQKGLIGIRPPNLGLKQSYEQLLQRFAELRGGNLWLPYLGSGFGQGPFVELLDGSIKYDFICGIGTHFFGHNHPMLLDACLEAALSDIVLQGHLQQNGDVAQLTATMCQAAKMDHCFLTTSGAMANENALKTAFQKHFPANRILAFEHCFAGRTLTLAQVTDKASFRDGLPLNVGVDYIPFFDANRPEESTQKALDVLKQIISRYPKQHAVMLCELVQGENGFYTGCKEFFSAVMQLLKENNISILIDEVQTFGRTPSLFAFHYYGLEAFADIVTTGKLGLVCATFFNKEHKPKTGLLSQTFISSTAAIHCAQSIFTYLQSSPLYGPEGKILKLFTHFSNRLSTLAKRNLVEGPFGIGSMIAFTPCRGNPDKVKKFILRLFEEGVVGFVAGVHFQRVRFLLPAPVLEYSHIDAVMEIVERILIEEQQ